MIKVRVEYYGVLEDVCGTRSEEVLFDAPSATVSDAMSRLIRRHEGLGNHCKHVAFALDDELSRDDAALRDGAVLALLPPVSGG